MSKKLPFKQVKRAHLYEEVANQIKMAIFDGVLEPGDSLPSERELAEMFGVGRPTIREALRILHLMGLIEINRGIRGSTVREIKLTQYLETLREHLSYLINVDDQSIQNLWEVRKYVELGIAHSAARNATEEDFEELERLIKEMEACGTDTHAYFPFATEFHKKIALASGNSIFYIIWSMFHDILLKGYMPHLDDLFPNGPQGLLRSNRILLAAIKSGDPSEIERAIQIHAEEERLFPTDKFIKNGRDRMGKV
ncbi:MAG: FadR family transcriptional regulator [Deltaproteobacteria bacterium]|nr:FadR family transcriptional regulator [Deltaproteobacteria bacterium]MBW2305082.1 FadR family transcriptional regulator [Deltaproteobacteria bacterium]